MMDNFNDNPILNSPYSIPTMHWHLDHGIPTGVTNDGRRPSTHMGAIPSPQGVLENLFEEKVNELTNRIRDQVDKWRNKPTDQWNVTYSTKKLLSHWRSSNAMLKPFSIKLNLLKLSFG